MKSLTRAAWGAATLVLAASSAQAQTRYTLPTGTVILVHTQTQLQSNTATQGQTFETVVDETVGVDNYIVAALVPAMADDLVAPIAAVGLLASAYALPTALLAPVFGPISDRRGRRYALLLGLGIFAIAAGACVVAPSLPVLMGARLINGVGAAIIAPCAHGRACPLNEPDWCHFARRVARSRIHRLTKDADVPWEDEKYIFIALSRAAPSRAQSRILAPPRRGAGRIELKLCEPDGESRTRLFSKRDGEAFKLARRVNWGDAFSAV